jgi:signal transduction histidine kinase
LNLDKRKKFRSIWAYSLGSILIIIVSLYFTNISIGIENFSNTVSLAVYTIIPGTLVILSIWAITRAETIQELPRNSLIFLVLSFFSWFIAEQTWNLYEHVLDIDPYPSVADFFYLAAPIFMLISLTIFIKSTRKKISKKIATFAGIISLVILIPSIVSTFEVGAEDEPFEIIIALSYPIVDAVVLIPVIITILFFVSNRKSFFWLMILAGMVIMLIADTAFLFLVINDEYVDGHPVDILWISSYTIWAFMMFYVIMESRFYQEQKEFQEIYKKIGTKKFEKYGVLIVLFLINTTIAILLIDINFFIQPKEGESLEFISWILAMMVIIFSSIIILLNSQLNKTLQNRTSQLEEVAGELIKSERFSAIGELASRISHDIRNPLSNIYMSIEMIKNSPPGTKLDDAVINEKLELVSKNIDRISHQVNDVLGFVKDRQMKKKNFKISSCLYEAIESISVPNNIKIKMSKSDINIIADPFQLQVVFNNLIMNAIQAIGKKKGEILIRFSEKNSELMVEVENSGPPIPDEILPHIFESLVTTKQIGTGLGLVSCKTIIENHQGTISARNDPTVLTITIPK